MNMINSFLEISELYFIRINSCNNNKKRMNNPYLGKLLDSVYKNEF